MHLSYTIAYDIAGIIILAVLIAIFHTSYQRREGRNLVFKSFLLSGLACGILDILTIFTITFSRSVPVNLNSLLIMLYHIAFSTFAFCGTNYVYTFLKSNALAGQIMDGVVSVVFLILYFVNQFNGMIFEFKNSIITFKNSNFEKKNTIIERNYSNFTGLHKVGPYSR